MCTTCHQQGFSPTCWGKRDLITTNVSRKRGSYYADKSQADKKKAAITIIDLWRPPKVGKEIKVSRILPACSPTISLDKIGIIIDVKGDGNCGYYAIMKGLQDLGCLDSKIQVTTFRKDLKCFGEIHAKEIIQLKIYQWGFTSLERQLNWWEKSVLGILYRDGIDFDTKGATKHYWLDVSYIVPLVAYKYQVSIYVYSKTQNVYRTDAFIYDATKVEQNGQVTKLESITIEMPSSERSICIVHNGQSDGSGHFMYLKVHKA